MSKIESTAPAASPSTSATTMDSRSNVRRIHRYCWRGVLLLPAVMMALGMLILKIQALVWLIPCSTLSSVFVFAVVRLAMDALKFPSVPSTVFFLRLDRESALPSVSALWTAEME